MITIIENPYRTVFSENAIPLVVETDNFLITGSPRDNFKIVLEIELESVYNSGTYDKKVIVKTIPFLNESNGNYTAHFDLQRLLDDWMTNLVKPYNVAYPVTNSNTVNIATNFRNWKYILYEEYGTPPVQDTATIIISSLAKINKVYKGGTSDRTRNKGYFFDGINETDSILTLFTKKRVLPNQPEFLQVYNHTNAAATISIDLIIKNIDGDTGTIPYPGTIPANIGIGESFVFQAGYNQLNIPNLQISNGFQALKDIIYWSFEISINGNTPTNKITYCLDCRHHQCKQFIQYSNSYGATETAHLTGVTEDRLKIKKYNYSRPRRYSNNILDNRTSTYKTESNKDFRARTGYQSRTQINYLQQMLLSKDVFILDTDNDEYIPILIDDGTFKIDECLEVLHSLTFNFIPEWSMGNFDLLTEKI